MTSKQEKIQASFMIASYLDTLGFKNGFWEFNYDTKISDIDIMMQVWFNMLSEFISLGGPSSINIKNWNASDDTIMIIATAEAVKNGDYKKKYLEWFEEITSAKRGPGNTIIESLKIIKQNRQLLQKEYMGGNGAAMRTGPIGLYYHNNEEKIIEQSILASIITHNYYIGFMGGVISALFASYAFNNIDPRLWVNKLIDLYDKKILLKYYPKEHNPKDLDTFMNYWIKYREVRVDRIQYKSSQLSFIYPKERMKFLMSFNPHPDIQKIVNRKGNLENDKSLCWNIMGVSGLDSCIFAYDCLLGSIIFHEKSDKIKDYSWDNFMINVAIHTGDNDTTGAIGGFWFGALLGFKGFNKERMKELEFYKELLKLSEQFI